MIGCYCKYNSVGQVPGQLYNAQVVDQDGKGLFAGFFYLDVDGKQIMDDKFTDDAGFFHFTVPDYNHQNIFIQFFATDEYDPVVKTFTEVVDNPKVVLKKKSKGLSIEALIGIAGIGISLYTLNKKKMGALPKPTKNQTVLLLAGGAAALYFIFRYKPTPEQKRFLDEAKNRLDYLAKELGIVPSLTLAQFSTLSTQIVRAVDKCGTDEDAIYRAFSALNNEADFWQLAISFGIAKYDGCFEGNLPSWNVHYTLPESLASDLSSYQVSAVNAILQDKDINVTI